MFSVGPNSVEYERDPTVDVLRQNVTNQIWNIIQHEEPTAAQPPQDEIKFVSFEDALKELASMKNGN